MQGRVAVVVPYLDVGASSEQRVDHRRVLVGAGRVVQGRVAVVVPRLDVGASGEQRVDHRRILVGAGRPVQGRVAIAILRCGVGACGHAGGYICHRRRFEKTSRVPDLAALGASCRQQRVDHRRILAQAAGRRVQGRVAVVVARLDVGARGEQRVDHRRILVGAAGRRVQGRVAGVVPCLDVGTSGEQRVDHGQIFAVAAGRLVQGRVAGVVPRLDVGARGEQRVDHRRILAEAPGRRVQWRVAEQAVPRLDVGASGEQRVDHRGILVEAGRPVQGGLAIAMILRCGVGPCGQAGGHFLDGRGREELLRVPVVAGARRWRPRGVGLGNRRCGQRRRRRRCRAGRLGSRADRSGVRRGGGNDRRRRVARVGCRHRGRGRRGAQRPGLGGVEIPRPGVLSRGLPGPDGRPRPRPEQAVRGSGVEALGGQPLLDQPPRRPVESQFRFDGLRLLRARLGGRRQPHEGQRGHRHDEGSGQGHLVHLQRLESYQPEGRTNRSAQAPAAGGKGCPPTDRVR